MLLVVCEVAEQHFFMGWIVFIFKDLVFGQLWYTFLIHTHMSIRDFFQKHKQISSFSIICVNVMHWLWIPRLIIHLSLIVSTAVIGATTTTVVSTQYPQQPVVQGGQYPPYQPMPSQAGYGGTPAYGGQPMPQGPYQGQPYVAGPPPPYQEAGKKIQPCTTKFSKLGNIYKNSWGFCCKCCECWNHLLGNRVSLSHDLWVMSMTVLRPILWIQNISVHQFSDSFALSLKKLSLWHFWFNKGVVDCDFTF